MSTKNPTLQRSPAALEKKFVQLRDEWRAQRGHEPSTAKIVALPAYQKIIGMGQDAIPFLLRELETNLDNWFWALMMITDENPVSEDLRGDGEAMARAWIQWGKGTVSSGDMAEELYDTDFPNLRGLGFERTSEPAYYNCIAYVAGDFRRKWWPGDYHPHMSPDYWPPGVPQEATLEAFVQALASVGYEACDDGNLESGFEKAALYAVGGEIRHAALQQHDGTWKSKLASDEDIRHSLEGLEGPLYGKIVAFLRRPRT